MYAAVSAGESLDIPSKEEIMDVHTELCDILRLCSERQARGALPAKEIALAIQLFATQVLKQADE